MRQQQQEAVPHDPRTGVGSAAEADGADEVVVDIVGLCKRFGDHEVLRDVDLTVRRGEVVSILGRSGGGKSTLLRCINLLETPSAGRLTVAGSLAFDSATGPVRGRALVDLRRRSGMLFQSLNVFPTMTVIENVALPLMRIRGLSHDIAVQRGIEMLERVGIPEKYRSMPASLSGGQLQRVALARALALNPLVLLFDEPTSALDPESTLEVLEVMKELSEDGMTMVVVTHEVRFALRVSDTVVFLHEGSVLEASPPDRIVSSQNPQTRQFLREHLSDGVTAADT